MPEPNTGTGSNDQGRPDDCGQIPPRAVTPLADAVIDVAARDVVSFHALPLSSGRSLTASVLSDRIVSLLGSDQLSSDVSYSGDMLDSFFRPRGPLLEAQNLAAQAFGSDATFFLSTGTSMANRVALSATVTPQSRVLVDRSCHQSVHFTLGNSAAQLEYGQMRQCCDACQRSFADLGDMLATIRSAALNKQPYDVVVLSATSYDGVRYNLPSILADIYTHAPNTVVLIDEAWAAIHGFHSKLRRYSALHAIAELRRKHPDIRPTVIVTHSAHKSMSALRQASFLHVVGDGATIVRISSALFELHTTSPSFPILASLDLARAQAESEGETLVDRSLALGNELRAMIRTDPSLSAYAVVSVCEYFYDPGNLVTDDPTKLLLDVSGLGISPARFRELLFRDHSIYVSRECGRSVLLNLHIGVDEACVKRLVEALRAIQHAHRSTIDDLVEGPCHQFIIAYPPGVPITVPGESLGPQTIERLRTLRSMGSEIFTLPNHKPLTTLEPNS